MHKLIQFVPSVSPQALPEPKNFWGLLEPPPHELSAVLVGHLVYASKTFCTEAFRKCTLYSSNFLVLCLRPFAYLVRFII